MEAKQQQQEKGETGSRLGVEVSNVVHLHDSTRDLMKVRFDVRVGKLVFRGIPGEYSPPNTPTFKAPWATKLCGIAAGEDEYRKKIDAKIQNELVAVLSVSGSEEGGWNSIN